MNPLKTFLKFYSSCLSMKLGIFLFFLILFSIINTNFISAASSNSSKEKVSNNWNSHMQELKGLTEKLVPVVFDEKTFENIKDSKEFENTLKDFLKLSHKLNLKASETSNNLPSADPSLYFVSELLEKNTKEALEAFRAGHKDYSRGLLKQNIALCFSCHSTSTEGVQLLNPEESKIIDSLNNLDKADYFTATRRFDKALDLYKSSYTNKSLAKNNPEEWQRSIRSALALAVRVKNDSILSESILSKASQKNLGASPAYFELLKSWSNGVNRWKEDQKRFNPPTSEEKHFEHITWLHQKAESQKHFPADQSAEIEYLRLTALAHQYLALYKNSKNVAEVLSFLGDGYDALRGLGGQWLFQNAYWEACIYAKPNTKTSWKCFEKYRDSVHRSYTGSSGTSIPVYLLFKLQELKTYAIP